MTKHVADFAAYAQSRFVLLPNRLLHHFVHTGGDGPKFVLLHGYTDSWRSFEPLFDLLGEDFRLLIPDQRGHGDSEAGTRYEIADFTRDAIEFIETVAKGPVYLAGHSLGSIVAQRVAEVRPDLVRGLVLIGAARHASAHPGLLELKAELSTFPGPIPHDFIETFQRGTTHAGLSSRQLDIFVEESQKLDPETWRKTLDGLVDEPVSHAQEPLKVPTLALWGIEDSVFDKGSQVTLARYISNLTTVHYPQVGHAPHWEIPERVAQDIRSFLLALEQEHTVSANGEHQHA